MTHLIADKEKKSASYKENRLEALSEEKVAKIKKFCKDYIAKLLRKLEKSGKIHRHGSSSSKSNGHGHHATPSTSVNTPNSGDGDDGEGMEMSVEEAMDLEADDDAGYNEEDTYDAGGADEGDTYDYEKAKSSPAFAPVPTSSSTSTSAYPQRRPGPDDSNGDASPSNNGRDVGRLLGERLPDWSKPGSVYDFKPDWG